MITSDIECINLVVHKALFYLLLQSSTGVLTCSSCQVYYILVPHQPSQVEAQALSSTVQNEKVPSKTRNLTVVQAPHPGTSRKCIQ